ncbi:MAG TPA: hypothetical protein VI685_08870 [Candidatus Angelobacter sp.]
MPVSLRHAPSAVTVWMSLFIPVLGLALQSSPVQANRQYQTAAQQAVNGPFRVAVQPVQQGVKQGSAAVLKIQLQNANNQVVNANDKLSFVVKSRSPGGKEQAQNVEIASGSDSGEVTLLADEAGLWKLEVRESNDRLVSGSGYLMVSSPSQVKKDMQRKPARPAVKPKSTGSAFMLAPRLILASYHPQMILASYRLQMPGNSPQSASKPKISLTVSGDADNKVLADGIVVADVALFLSSPQAADVQISLSATQGQVSPQMVIIKKGELQGTAKWTSKTIAENATISIKDVTPRMDTAVVSQTISFTDPIVAIAFFNPPSTLNIVERGLLAVQFLDRTGTPVPAHEPLSFSFSADSPHLNVVPISSETKPNALNIQASVIPSGFGKVNIQATVGHLRSTTPVTIKITGLLLLILCAAGGALGGLVNHLDLKQKGLVASLVTGMVVAFPITWLYVWVGLPHVDASILHNQPSAVMVAIIAGISGAGGLRKAAQKFGFDLFESPDAKATSAAA